MPKKVKPLSERLWDKVTKGGPDECWPWSGAKTTGYGSIQTGTNQNRKSRLAHVVAYELTYGPVPEGQIVRHKCHNRACCNPAHLISGSHNDNMKDMTDAGRQAKGERHGRAKLTCENVVEIRKSPLSARKLSRMYGVSSTTIDAARSGRTWDLLEP